MSTDNSTQTTLRQVLNDATRIPGRDWLFHPAVPLALIVRHPVAQRNSPLDLLRKKGGKFDANKAGLPRVVPNASKAYAVTGATRVEWAKEAGQTTTPAEIWPEEMSVKEMATFFLDELQHIEPNIRITQKLGEVAEKPAALAVRNARAQLPGTTVIGAFRIIYGQKNGAILLQRTVTELKRTWPRSIKEISAPVIRGMALLLSVPGGTVARKWRKLSPQILLQRARTRLAQHGGKGSMASHVAALLKK